MWSREKAVSLLGIELWPSSPQDRHCTELANNLSNDTEASSFHIHAF
jgi:hypothetical protein